MPRWTACSHIIHLNMAKGKYSLLCIFSLTVALVMAKPAMALNANADASHPSAPVAAVDSVAMPATVYIDPLFEYPVAPDELEDLTSRTSWIMAHFWDNMNFKKKRALDQNAVNDAFGVYAASMPYAPRTEVDKSVDQLVKKLSSNPVLLIQFTKAAEESLYGSRANVWIDEVYMRFLKALTSNKKIDKTRKLRYADQLRRLEASQPGQTFPALPLTDRNGNVTEWKPTADFNIIEFGMPDCDDCRQGRILMEVDIPLNEAIDAGKVSMTFVVTDDDADGQLMDMTRSYSRRWQVGKNGDVDTMFDLRLTPSFYLVDRQGKIIDKNLPMQEVMRRVREL